MKRILYAFAALLCFAACTKELPKVTIYAVQTFNSENVAAATLKLSVASKNDIQVLLEGTPADKLSFHDVVDIPAGSTSAGCIIRVNPEGIDPNAPIQIFIKDAIGAKVGAPAMVTIGLSSSYNGGDNGGNGGDNGGGNGEEEVLPGGFTKVSAWTIEMDGEPYTDEFGDWIDLKVVTDGIKYYDVTGITNSEFAEYYENVEDYFQSWEDYVSSQSDISEWLFSDGDYTYISYPGEGAGKIFLVEFDANGKLTGRYNAVDVVFPEFEGGGGDIEIDATLVSTWTATMDGEPYTDEYGDWIDLNVTTPGIKYYAVEGITDDTFNNYYDSVEELIIDWAYEVEGYLDDGDELEDILFADGEYTYIEYPGEGQGKIFIIEFDADGAPTGRYGVSSATFPEFEGGNGGGGGSLDDFKKEIGVPETFTVNTAFGAEYFGVYNGSSGNMDVFTASGTGDAMWSLNIYEAGTVSAEDIPDLAKEIASYIEETLAEYIDYFEDYFTYFYEDLGDFLAQEILGTYEGEKLGYDVHEAGNYDAVIFTFTEDGDMTGEYNIVTVAVDGHDYVAPEAAPALRRLMARASRPHRKLQMSRPDTHAIKISKKVK